MSKNHPPVFFIINPVSGDGSAFRYWTTHQSTFLSRFEKTEYAITKYPGHATEITRTAVKNGFKTIVSIGGDGLNNEVANGMLENDRLREPDLKLAIVAMGTGCDLARTLHLEKNPHRYLDAISEGDTLSMDVGKATYKNQYDVDETRYFLNVAECGFISQVIQTYSHRKSRIIKNGLVPYLLSYISTSRDFGYDSVSISINGNEPTFEDTANINVANAKFYGGGFKIAPDADVTDGQLDLITFKRQNWVSFSMNMIQSLKGTHIKNTKNISTDIVKTLTLEPLNPLKKIHLDLDGDIYGSLPVKFAVVSKCLPIIVT